MSNCVWVQAFQWRIACVTWRVRCAFQTRICRIRSAHCRAGCHSQTIWLTVVYMGANVCTIGRRWYPSGGRQRLSLGPFRVIYEAGAGPSMVQRNATLCCRRPQTLNPLCLPARCIWTPIVSNIVGRGHATHRQYFRCETTPHPQA